MPLFGPPNVAKLEAKRDVKGLIQALAYPKDPTVRVAAAEALDRLGWRPDGAEAEAVAASPAPEPGADARVVRVFVSSTFRDMGAERDELVKRVFPQLRKMCESRGVTWGEVDLRWGLTDEQKAEGKVLPMCLAEIRGCRPFFLGLLGERYGWVPDALDPALVEQEPWLAQQAGRSVTELEILHGALRDPATAGHALFYLRDPDYVEGKPPDQYREIPTADEIASLGDQEAEQRATERRARLAALKERIRSGSLPVREAYRDPEALGKLVLADLSAIIERLYPEGSTPDPLDREAAEHEAFAASRSGVYVGRADYFRRLDAHAAGDDPPLVVVGESGLGKSALLANWARRYRAAHPDELVLLHFIGAAPASTDWAAMVRRIIGELSRRLAFEIEIPDQPEALRMAFAKALEMAAAEGRVVLVLDALNQLEDREGALELAWLPPEIPAGVRLVVSTLPGQPLAELERRGCPALAVQPLEPAERERLIVDYLAGYTKALGPALRQRVASGPQCANPLFLRALLEELRLWGEHETLEQQIEHYLAAPTVDSLYRLILARYEADYERERPGLVREAFSLLWAAHRGLSESELLDMLGGDGQALPRAFWSPLFLAAESSLTSRSGLLGFFHDYLRAAVEHLYLEDEQYRQAAHLRLADYFAARELAPRTIDELPWQLARAQAWERLSGLLADLEFLEAALRADQYGVMSAWAQVEDNSSLRLVDAYRPVVDDPAGHSARQRFIVAQLLQQTGHPDQALSLQEHVAQDFSELGDQAGLQASLGEQAVILMNRGDLDGAMALLEENERICRELEDLEGLETCFGYQARILRERGDLDGAMALFRGQERICRDFGLRGNLLSSLGNQALILQARGDLDEAMALHKEGERICRELGDLRSLQASLGNQALILQDRGDLDGAMALHAEQERICRELGDPASLQASLGNQGIILRARGDLDGALAQFREQERICRELGDSASLANSLGNQALILQARGALDDAMALHKEQERISRELGDPAGLANSLGNQALVLGLGMGQPQAALPLAEEAYGLANEHGLDALAQQIGMILERLQGRG